MRTLHLPFSVNSTNVLGTCVFFKIPNLSQSSFSSVFLHFLCSLEYVKKVSTLKFDMPQETRTILSRQGLIALNCGDKIQIGLTDEGGRCCPKWNQT